MLIDTHCHINLMVKKEFDRALNALEIAHATDIIEAARVHDVTTILNVGTSVIESKNSVALAQAYKNVYAAIGIHPNDATEQWRADVQELHALVQEKEKNNIVAVGEIGFDKHYPDYNIQRQKDVFRAQVDMALASNLPILIHSRDATDETLYAIDEYSKQGLRGVVHCFSDPLPIAHEYITRNFLIGMGGTVTYPKNHALRTVATTVPLEKIVLETDAPYLPPQELRGKQNHPQYIQVIARFIAQLRGESYEHVAQVTTDNANGLLRLREM
ncbi:MAG: TatD family hydrolase [Candidatus Babeliales bacterium]